MRLSDWMGAILFSILSAIVFGYGHYLADEPILEWLSVATWAVIQAGIIGIALTEFDTRKQGGR